MNLEFGCAGVRFEAKFTEENGLPPGSFEGYAAVFGNVDSHGDVIEPGAFAKSLLERERAGRALPPMYKMHGGRLFKGNQHEPVGVWTKMSEDSNGLPVAGRLIGLDTEQGKWNYAQLKEGGLSGISIGYQVPPHGAKNGTGRPGEPKRYLKMLNLNEVSLVDDPSNVLARVYMMKSRWSDERVAPGEIKSTGDLAVFIEQNIHLISEAIATKGWKDAIREFEGLMLREEAKFSHAAAKAIALSGFKSAPLEPRDEDRASLIAAAFKGVADRIRGL